MGHPEQKQADDTKQAADAKALEKEQEKLRKYVDTAQLELHFSGLVNDAREEIRQMIDAEGEATAEGLEGEGKD